MTSQATVQTTSDFSQRDFDTTFASDTGFPSDTVFSNETVSCESAREHILKNLNERIAVHDATAADLGSRYASRISQFRWNSDARRFICTLPVLAHGGEPEVNGNGARESGANGADGEIRVEVDLPFAVGDPLRLVCSCQRGQGGERHCAHTWAALTRFVDLIHEHEDHPLLDEVFHLESTPAWTRTLAALDDFLDRQPSVAEPVPESRLVWRVKTSPLGVELAAWEQRVSTQSGEWTRGRQVAWERLRESPELWTCEADRRAAAAVTEHVASYSGYEPVWAWQLDIFTALTALSGHPLVFRWGATQEQPVTIEKVELVLTVTPSAEGLVLDAALGEQPLRLLPRERLWEDEDERGLVGWTESGGGPDHIFVASAHPSVLRFVRSLDGKPRIVPPEGQSELLRRLNHLETLLPVRLPPELAGVTVPADPRLYLRLAPLHPSGVAVQIRVRPAPEGFYSIPGEGPPRLSGVEEARRVFAERDLDGERARGRELAEVLGLDAYPEERLFQWRILEDDAALDLILAAQFCDEEGLATVEWPLGGRRSVEAPLTPTSLKIEVEDRRDWFSLNADLKSDGWRLSLLELLIALRRGRRYIRLGDSDSWAEIEGGFRERLEALDDVVHHNRERLEIDASGAPALRDLVQDTEALKASRKWKRLTRRLDEADQFHPDPPQELLATLRSYQLEGFRWMCRLAYWGVGGCLADDMGLGKTVQTLSVLLARRDEGPSLVVAPTSLGFNWVREAERFTPTLKTVLFRDVDRASTVRKLQKGDLVIVSYGLLVREIERLGKIKWGTLILDEAQAIKNSQSKTAQAVRQVEARWRLALTGTPIENHLGELWSLFRVVSPGLFGSWQRFRERFAAPIQKEGDTDRSGSLSRLVRPFILRRTKSEVLHELPARTEVDLYAELSSKERDLYEDIRLKTLVNLSHAETDSADQRFQVLAALTRLRQLACHPALVEDDWEGDSAKLTLLLDLVEELREEDHRALIFSQFTGHLALIRKALEERGFRCQYLDGQTPVRERGTRVDAFQAGEGDVFLISLMAGGTGLNLTAADYVIHMDPWWNPAVEDQATDRAHRMGQKRPVTVYRLVSEGTIEEEILRLHADKRDLVAGVLEGTDQAAQLSTAELVGLIRSGGNDGEG